MGFCNTTLEQPKPRQKQPDCGQKIASRKIFSYPIKTALKNQCNPLKTQQDKLTLPTKTASGVFYYKYRHYDPQLGRWPSRDPIEEDGGVNLYAFVGNDPVSRWDRFGLIKSNSVEHRYKAIGIVNLEVFAMTHIEATEVRSPNCEDAPEINGPNVMITASKMKSSFGLSVFKTVGSDSILELALDPLKEVSNKTKETVILSFGGYEIVKKTRTVQYTVKSTGTTTAVLIIGSSVRTKNMVGDYTIKASCYKCRIKK
jgi:RHS repeat-associated protein